MNQYTAQVPFAINGTEYMLELDWRAVARIKTELGDRALANIHSHSPEDIATIIIIALAKHHPEVTREMVLDGSPPWLLTLNKIQLALAYFYWGAEGPPQDKDAEPEEDESKKN